MKTEADEQARFDQPYPLLRSFVRFILPGLALLLVVSAALTMYVATGRRYAPYQRRARPCAAWTRQGFRAESASESIPATLSSAPWAQRTGWTSP